MHIPQISNRNLNAKVSMSLLAFFSAVSPSSKQKKLSVFLFLRTRSYVNFNEKKYLPDELQQRDLCHRRCWISPLDCQTAFQLSKLETFFILFLPKLYGCEIWHLHSLSRLTPSSNLSQESFLLWTCANLKFPKKRNIVRWNPWGAKIGYKFGREKGFEDLKKAGAARCGQV